jgi:hypothetical protein
MLLESSLVISGNECNLAVNCSPGPSWHILGPCFGSSLTSVYIPQKIFLGHRPLPHACDIDTRPKLTNGSGEKLVRFEGKIEACITRYNVFSPNRVGFFFECKIAVSSLCTKSPFRVLAFCLDRTLFAEYSHPLAHRYSQSISSFEKWNVLGESSRSLNTQPLVTSCTVSLSLSGLKGSSCPRAPFLHTWIQYLVSMPFLSAIE